MTADALPSPPDQGSGVAGDDAIPRHHDLRPEVFRREYGLPMKPVVLTGAIGRWPALGLWTPRLFARRYGALEVSVEGQPYKMADLIAAIESSTGDRPAPYFRDLIGPRWNPDLRPEISPRPACIAPNWLDRRLSLQRGRFAAEIYIGGCGARFPFVHYDFLHTHAFLMQVFGRKRFFLFPPEQAPFLYPLTGAELGKAAIDDVEAPDLTRFPLFAEARPQVSVLEPGEMLFIPAGWWHTTRMLSASITVGINAVNAANWRAFVADHGDDVAARVSRLRGWMLRRYLGGVGLVYRLTG
jgi:cupin-like protein